MRLFVMELKEPAAGCRLRRIALKNMSRTVVQAEAVLRVVKDIAVPDLTRQLVVPPVDRGNKEEEINVRTKATNKCFPTQRC